MLNAVALAAIVLTAGLTGANPLPEPKPSPQGKKSAVAGQCSGQSCYVASLAHSTEEPFKIQNGKKPGGGNAGGDRCIKQHYQKLGLPAPPIRRVRRGEDGVADRDYPQDDPSTISAYLQDKRRAASRMYRRHDAALPPVRIAEIQESSLEGAAPNAACKGNILIFARGTTETGTMGTTVGPALSSRLTGDWEVTGVRYDASLAGIYCIGMPGGLNAKGILENKVKTCPDSKIFLSGYSQGAMVVREAVAWTTPDVRSHVMGILTFGDPFNGATVKGFDKSKIKVLCNKTDGVCIGDFSIGAGHLSYVADGSIGEGVNWLKKTAASSSVSKSAPKGEPKGEKEAAEEEPAAAAEEKPAGKGKGKLGGLKKGSSRAAASEDE